MRKPATINRRDFINGTALSLGLGTALSPLEILARTSGQSSANYPPGLTGMRGSTDAAFEVAHAIAREGRKFPRPVEQSEKTYDLIVVGGGISGLSAAKFFRDRSGSASSILVLDNHDDFGGHARRNEFNIDGKTLLGYGGSVAIERPSKYSKTAAGLLRNLSIDTQRFYDYYDHEFYPNRNLGAGVFFDKATYGVDQLSASPLPGTYSDALQGEELAAAVGAMPIPEQDKGEFVRLLTGGVDYLQGKTVAEKKILLNNISYLDYLREHAGMPESVLDFMRDTFLMLTAAGWEAVSALFAAHNYFPGTVELGVQDDDGEDEPFIFHFPDGNAGVARALVRDLIPRAIQGRTMEDLVTARADYSQLDVPEASVRVRLNSTAVNVQNTADGKYADVIYVRNGEVLRARAKHVVLACYNGIVPYLCPEVPQKQLEALRAATKLPFVIGSVVLRNWQAFVESGFATVYTPGNFIFKNMFLDLPVSMGDYQFSSGPDEPIVLSMWHSPTTRGLPAQDQWRAGRAKLLQTSYDDLEQNIYAHLDSALGPHGFDAEREIAAITLNRWSHGYAWEYEGIGVPPEYDRYHGPHIAGRAQMGRISIANADSEAYAYVDGAIDAADRAVSEQLN